MSVSIYNSVSCKIWSPINFWKQKTTNLFKFIGNVWIVHPNNKITDFAMLIYKKQNGNLILSIWTFLNLLINFWNHFFNNIGWLATLLHICIYTRLDLSFLRPWAYDKLPPLLPSPSHITKITNTTCYN